MYRLVALDVDGTLLDPSHALTTRTQSAILSAQRGGITVCLATGKLLVSVMPLLRELRLGGLHVTCNGAAVMDSATGTSVASWPLNPYQIEISLAAVRALAPEMPIAWYTTDTIYSDAPVGLLDTTLKAYQEPPVRHVERLDGSLPPPLKFLMTGDHARLLELRDGLLDHIGPEVTVTRTTDEFVEIMAPGVNKGVALLEVAKTLGIARDAIVAMGDGENDISLLEAAGLGIAMGNAMPALRERATQFTRSNADDGVAYALERLGLTRPC